MTEDRFTRMQQRVFGVVVEELQGIINDMLRGMLDPSRIMAFISSMGFNISQLPGMMSQQPGFNPYQVLGLDKSASDEEIRKRYRELLYRLHPDKSGTPGTTFLFRMVMAAYEIIKRERGWQ